MIRPSLLIIIVFWGMISCQKSKKVESVPLDEQQQFERYLEIGNSIYAQKKGLNSFAQSMVYFDSAMSIARHTQDTLMLAKSIFAKGRVYDAWNRKPLKTIALFQETADLYKAAKVDIVEEYYVRHLVAHAYAKMYDTTNCVKKLEALYDDIIQLSPEIRQKMEYISKMANISCWVGNYDLAEKILNNLCERAWIKNNPTTYNYEDYYFMTRSSIDLYKYKRYETVYLDSVELCLKTVDNPMDSLLYLNILLEYYANSEQYKKAYHSLKVYERLFHREINEKGISSMENQLLNMELQTEKRKAEAEHSISRSRNIVLLVLIIGFIIVGLVSYRFRQEYLISQSKSKQLEALNQQLVQKVEEVELVSKEVQHRIKNNLHLIFSLLNMQERKSENPDTIENLQKARLRIESIAGLHDLLGQSNNAEVDFSKYINNLVETIINCIETEHKVITNLAIQQIMLPQNYFFSIGLILNEWITNSIKYAETKSPLVLSITIIQKDGFVIIEYHDNGNLTQKQVKKGLGKEIIDLLTRQMKGKLTQHPENIYHFFLKIKNEHKN